LHFVLQSRQVVPLEKDGLLMQQQAQENKIVAICRVTRGSKLAIGVFSGLAWSVTHQ